MTAPSDEPAEEWVSANELMISLGEHGPPMPTVVKRVCKHAREGLVRARALRFFDGREHQTDCPVPKEFWWTEGGEGLEQDWFSGWFETPNPTGHGRWRAFGVHFCKSEAERWLSGKFTEARRRGGGRPPHKLWPDLVAELVVHLYFDDPEGEGSEGADAVIDHVLRRLSENGLGEMPRTTVQPAVQAALRRLRAEKLRQR